MDGSQVEQMDGSQVEQQVEQMDGSQVEELMEITAQSLVDLEIQDRFDVIKEIGRGKYGRVLLVMHRCRGTPMALKVMPKASTHLSGFLREYCTSLDLSRHPCIVGMFGIVFRSTEHYCFAQELVIGRDLFAVLQPKVGLPELWVKRCALQISSALEFIHSRGLVHRDVKPENVLLSDARCCKVKLADFGLAQRRGAFIRFISGTLPYSAPELCARVLQDGQVKAPPLKVEPSLDTWAFGVLLFCILTGFFPWESCCEDDSFYRTGGSGAREREGEGERGREQVKEEEPREEEPREEEPNDREIQGTISFNTETLTSVERRRREGEAQKGWGQRSRGRGHRSRGRSQRRRCPRCGGVNLRWDSADVPSSESLTRSDQLQFSSSSAAGVQTSPEQSQSHSHVQISSSSAPVQPPESKRHRNSPGVTHTFRSAPVQPPESKRHRNSPRVTHTFRSVQPPESKRHWNSPRVTHTFRSAPVQLQFSRRSPNVTGTVPESLTRSDQLQISSGSAAGVQTSPEQPQSHSHVQISSSSAAGVQTSPEQSQSHSHVQISSSSAPVQPPESKRHRNSPRVTHTFRSVQPPESKRHRNSPGVTHTFRSAPVQPPESKRHWNSPRVIYTVPCLRSGGFKVCVDAGVCRSLFVTFGK
ncbi:hypothetical protein WMY93_027140 [Mugilogobius chulae]|uniref:Protein kinase domain-containing protein n=1 Tax=Mugilogobius chulae TaxID=88201 RepID=A0AAW0MWG4_9GOBI